MMASFEPWHLVATSALFLFLFFVPASGVGVNYGTLGNNLPPPAQVAEFLRSKTIIDRVRLFDANPDILRAFAGSGIAVSVTTPNGDIPNLAQLSGAQQWVAANVAPFYPATNIARVLVGTEVLHWGPQNLIDNLVPAMKTMRQALDQAGFRKIQVSTAHSLGILERSWPPSSGKFRPGWDTGVLAPVLKFHRETKSPFIVNPYPYFAANAKTYEFCSFQYSKGWRDQNTKMVYTNMFDVLMDATFNAMKRLGYADVDIAVGETGWPTVGDTFQTWVSVEAAQAYVGGLVRHLKSRFGTPMMPKKRFEVFIFALFQENLKPGPIAEQNFGVFRPDFSPVYDSGLMRAVAKPTPKPSPTSSSSSSPSPSKQQKQWCVPKASATPAQLQSNVDYVCSQGIDCKPIQAGGSCFDPPTVKSHAAYVMNAYYQAKGHFNYNCDFAGTGQIVYTNPSYKSCAYKA